MVQTWVKKTGSSKLAIFFTGWGMTPEITSDLLVIKEQDLLVCYDYRSLEEPEDIKQYQHITIIAYSLGVWAASYVIEHFNVCANKLIAINGTGIPVSDEFGIAEAVYKKTNSTLTKESHLKFILRMCGNKADYSRYTERMSEPDIKALQDELTFINTHQLDIQPFNKWDLAILSTNDAIFSYQNLCQYYNRSQTRIVSLNTSHFPFYQHDDLLIRLIENEGVIEFEKHS